MRIAIDIDKTVYDTEWCIADVHRLIAKEIPATSPKQRYNRLKELDDASEVWFNPKYLIPKAIKVLKERQELGDELFICTNRHNDEELYLKLFEHTGLKFTRIIQYGYYTTKADACLDESIDIIIDDEMDNIRDHRCMLLREDLYTTHFIAYIGHSTSYYADIVSMSNVSIMCDWSELSDIIKGLKL